MPFWSKILQVWPKEPLRLFYELLSKQPPSSEMAEFVGAPPVLLKYPPITFRPGSSKYAPRFCCSPQLVCLIDYMCQIVSSYKAQVYLIYFSYGRCNVQIGAILSTMLVVLTMRESPPSLIDS